MIGSILILDDDGRHLLRGAGPSLPDACNEAIHGIEIGPEVGCGTAAYHDKTVSVFDIANNPLWANFKDLALQYLRACWSTPIHGAEAESSARSRTTSRFVRDPSPLDQQLTDRITRTAQIAVARSLFALDGVIPSDQALAAQASEIFRRLGSPRRRAADIAIGVTAAASSAILLTRNARDFAGIPELQLEAVS